MKIFIVILEQNNETHEIVGAFKSGKSAENAVSDYKQMAYILTEGWSFSKSAKIVKNFAGLYEIVDENSERAYCVRIAEVELKN